MKKSFILLIIFSILSFVSCGGNEVETGSVSKFVPRFKCAPEKKEYFKMTDDEWESTGMWQFRYNDEKLLEKAGEFEDDGQTFSYEYNSDGNVVKTVFDDGGSIFCKWDGNKLLGCGPQEDNLTNLVNYENGMIKSYGDEDDTITLIYDDNKRLIGVQNVEYEDGEEYDSWTDSIQYNSDGRLISSEDDEIESVEYNSEGFVTQYDNTQVTVELGSDGCPSKITETGDAWKSITTFTDKGTSESFEKFLILYDGLNHPLQTAMFYNYGVGDINYYVDSQ